VRNEKPMKAAPFQPLSLSSLRADLQLRAIAASATAWLWVFVVLAAVLRLATLDKQSFWLDEAVSYRTAALPLPALLDAVAQQDIHPPLYYVLLHYWLRAGDSEFWLRLLSVLFSVASVWLIGRLGQSLLEPRAGVVAAAILAVSPLHVWYAREARMYALVVLLALASVTCLWRALMAERRAGWWWAGVVVSGTLLLYTSTTGIWLLAALNVFVLGWAWARRRWPALGGWWLSQAAIVLLFLPWLPSLANQLAISRRLASWIPAPTVGSIINLLGDFNSRNLPFWFRASLDGAAAAGTNRAPGAIEPEFGIANIGFVAVVLAAAVGLTLRRRRAGQWLLWCLLVVPVGLAFLLSQKYVRLPLLTPLLGDSQSFFTVKNLIVASVPYYLLVASVLTAGRRWVLAGGLTLLLGLNMISHRLEPEVRAKEDWRGVVATLREQAGPADVIVFSPGYLELGYAYYARHAAPLAPTRGFPTDEVGLHEPVRTWTADEAVAGARRVWLIESPDHAPQSHALAEHLATTGAPAVRQEWPGITVRRFDLPGSAPDTAP